MAINFPVNGDRDSGENFSLWSGRVNMSAYVHTGMDIITSNGTAGTFDIAQGHCFVKRNDLDKVVGINDGEHTGISYDAGARNHIYIVPRYQGDNKSDIYVENPDSTPNDPHLKIAILDDTGSSPNVERPNERPNVYADDQFVNRARFEEWVQINDDVELQFGENSDYTARYLSSNDDLIFEGPIGRHMTLFNGGRTRVEGRFQAAGPASAEGSELLQEDGSVPMSNTLTIENTMNGVQFEPNGRAGLITLANENIAGTSANDTVGLSLDIEFNEKFVVRGNSTGNDSVDDIVYEFYNAAGNQIAELSNEGNLTITGTVSENATL